MIFYWSLSDSKSPQVSRILLIILGDLNNAVVSAYPLIYKSSRDVVDIEEVRAV